MLSWASRARSKVSNPTPTPAAIASRRQMGALTPARRNISRSETARFSDCAQIERQGGFNGLGQIGDAEGLLQKRTASQQDVAPRRTVFRITRHEKHSNGWVEFRQVVRQL